MRGGVVLDNKGARRQGPGSSLLFWATALVACAPRAGSVGGEGDAPPTAPETTDVVEAARRDGHVDAWSSNAISPASVCRAGCDRLQACSEAAAREAGAPAIDRCHRECARLDSTRREGMGQVQTCLQTSGCEQYVACLREDIAPSRVAVSRIDGPSLTRCERVCGAYAECGVATQRTSPDSAPSVEMGCLEVCLAVEGDAESQQPPQLEALEQVAWCDDLIEGVQALAQRGQAALANGPETAASSEGMACEVVCDRLVGCMKDWADDHLGGEDLQRTRDTCVQSMCVSTAPRRELERLRACVEFSECTDVLGCLVRSGRNP